MNGLTGATYFKLNECRQRASNYGLFILARLANCRLLWRA